MDVIRKARIEQGLKDMPPIYRGSYRKAIQGKSLRAAVNSFCLECCGWQRNEVRDCSSLACPVYKLRPYQRTENQGREGGVMTVESTNTN
jgi:hypothetical protein